jgi:hypothetical protein
MTRLLLFSILSFAGSVCFAQRGALPTALPPEKKPCDVLTKADAESIMGQPAELRDHNPFQCGYVEIGWTNKPSSILDKRPTEGLDSMPALELYPQMGDDCKNDPSWRDFWSAEFQWVGWVKFQPGLTLSHFNVCEWLPGNVGFYRLDDSITLYEDDVVFELNGRLFRKTAELFSTYRLMTTLEDLAAVQQGFIPRSIMQFSTDLTLGKRAVPFVSPASSVSPGAN